ncbi:MAG: thiamine-phosphate kinase [Mycobacteriaceae bacterium]
MTARPPSSSEPSTVAEVGEVEVIARVTRPHAGSSRTQPASTLLGPGDDAAVVAAADSRVVASTDVLVEGVHFRLDWSTPEQVGRRAVAQNVADVVAMGAVPTALLVGLACPPDTPVATLERIADGLWDEAGRVGAGVVGGDVVRAGQLVVSVTVLGDLQGREPVLRSGAQPGDVVALAGRLGWSAAGLAVLGRGFRAPAAVVAAYRVPEPPYSAGVAAARGGASAMTDVSDGLLSDLGQLLSASGVAADLRRGSLSPAGKLVEVGSALGVDPWLWVLTGGEDHALVATFPPQRDLPEGWSPIGMVTAGSGLTVDGAVWDTEDGPTGWTAFR